MKVLIALDESEHSEKIIREVLDFEWSADSEFKIISVLDNSFLQSSGSELADTMARKLIDDASEKLRSGLRAGQRVSAQVLSGYPKSEIVNCAEYWPADLIIMGSRGRKGLKRILLGSVSHSVLVAAKCSVRISRTSDTSKYPQQKIIVGFDDSTVSDTIVERITTRPWRKGVHFSCITVLPTLMQNFYGVQDSHEIDSLEVAHKDKVKAAKVRLEKLSQTIQSKIPDSIVSFEVLEGDARELLVDKAKDTGASLIIVGHKGKNWMDRLLIGSVSEAVATWATCSVAVVK